MLDSNEYDSLRAETKKMISDLVSNRTRSEPNADDVNKYRCVPNPDDVNKYRVSKRRASDPIWVSQFKL